MSTSDPAFPIRPRPSASERRTRGVRRFLETTAIVLGSIMVFLGVFVSFAGENQTIGFFGIWSVQADEVSGWWTIALLAGGAVILALAFRSVALRRRSRP